MRVAIIGAGITGSLLASRLSSAGLDVTVFEKSRGCGGRVSSKHTDWGQWDLGATVIPASGPDFLDFMHKQCEQNLASRWPKAAFLCRSKTDLKTSLEPYYSDREYFVFNHKMNSTCRIWTQKADLHINSLVSQVRYHKGKGWQLNINQAWQDDWFEKVVVTAPWPQSRLLCEQSDLPISLPNLSQSWTSCWSVAFKTSQVVKAAVDLVYLKEQTVQTLVRDSSKPLRSTVSPSQVGGESEIWVAQLANDCSDKLGKSGRDKAITFATHRFCELFDLPLDSVSNHYAHYWRYARPSSGQLPLGIVRYPEQGLYLGGDWSFGASIEAGHEAAITLSEAIIRSEE